MGESGPDDRSSATIKYGSGYEAPWFVAHGTPDQIRRQIKDAFDLHPEEGREVSLAELVALAAVSAQSIYSLAKGLNAKPVSDEPGTTRRSGGQKTRSKPNERPVDAERPNEGVHQEIEAAGSLDDLKLAWAQAQDAFSNDKALQAAYNAKHKELKGKQEAK